MKKYLLEGFSLMYSVIGLSSILIRVKYISLNHFLVLKETKYNLIFGFPADAQPCLEPGTGNSLHKPVFSGTIF